MHVIPSIQAGSLANGKHVQDATSVPTNKLLLPLFQGSASGDHFIPSERLASIQDTLTQIESLTDYDVSMQESYEILSERGLGFFKKLLNDGADDALSQYQGEHKLGILEETADVLFEYYALQAIKMDIVSEGGMDRFNQVLADIETNDDDYTPPFSIAWQAMVETIKEKTSDEQIEKFMAISGIRSEKRALNLLGLIAFKFSILEEDEHILAKTRQRVYSEAVELGEHQGRYGSRSPMLEIVTAVFSRFTQLPSQWLGKYLQRRAEKSLDIPVSHDDFLRYMFIKLLARQETHYEHQDTTYDERKRLYKPMEALLEASILHHAEERDTQKPVSRFKGV